MDPNAAAQVAQANADAVRVIGETLNRLSDNMDRLTTASTQQQEQITMIQHQLQQSIIQPQHPPIASSTPYTAPSSQAIESSKEPRIATYDGSPSFAFDDWALHTKALLTFHNLHPPRSLLVVIGALRGDALKVAGRLVETIDHYASNDEFFKRLRDIFVTPAHRDRARAEFMKRVQKKDESIKLYHGLVGQLYNDAFTEDERSERIKIDRFVDGIRNRYIREKIYDSANFGDNFPKRYSTALNIALGFEATAERMAISDRDFGYTESLFLPTTERSLLLRSRVRAPMPEIGAMKPLEVNPNQKQIEFFPPKRQGTNPRRSKPKGSKVVVRKSCTHCGKVGHEAEKCWIRLNAAKKCKAPETKKEPIKQFHPIRNS